ncbi:MAG TPA: hypothetical protein VGG27_10960 [Magnetospirillaceae bacterium]|jgi:hypothetical protein
MNRFRALSLFAFGVVTTSGDARAEDCRMRADVLQGCGPVSASIRRDEDGKYLDMKLDNGVRVQLVNALDELPPELVAIFRRDPTAVVSGAFWACPMPMPVGAKGDPPMMCVVHTMGLRIAE